MMQKHVTFIAFLFALSTPVVTALCGSPPGSLPDWQCNVCGDNGGAGAQGIGCEPRNATFDDVSTGSLSTHNAVGGRNRYMLSNWTNVDVYQPAKSTSNARISPYSLPAYAKVSAGKTGNLVFSAPGARTSELGDVYGGGVYSLHYACALPSTGAPTTCTVNATSYCQHYGSSTPTYKYATALLKYTAVKSNTSMAYAERFVAGLYDGGPGFPQGSCYNLTLSAVSQSGQAVDLFVDDILLFAFVKEPGSIGA